jgi:3-oxoacyl-[acyl-carrier protein] reductase
MANTNASGGDPGVAIVTGGSSGIGAAVVARLAARGHEIVVADVNDALAGEVVDGLAAAGTSAVAIHCDVREEDDIAAVLAAAQELGTLTTLVCCAGLAGRSARMERHDDDEWRRILDVNLGGVILCTRAVGPVLRAQRRGSIVHIASMAGLVGSRGQVVYSGSKAGVIGVTKAAAKELMAEGVRVNAVAPGFIDTPMTEAMTDEVKEAWGIGKFALEGRLGSADEIAGAVEFLTGPDSTYVTGTCLSVDGGFQLGYP